MGGIDTERDEPANLQIGVTTLGMVRIHAEQGGAQVTMDFDPEDAEQIAEEIRAAAARGRAREKGGKRRS